MSSFDRVPCSIYTFSLLQPPFLPIFSPIPFLSSFSLSDSTLILAGGCWYWSEMCFLFLSEGPWDHHTTGVSSNPEQSSVNQQIRPLRYFNIAEVIREKEEWKPKMCGWLISWAWLICSVWLVCWVLFVTGYLVNCFSGADWAAGFSWVLSGVMSWIRTVIWIWLGSCGSMVGLYWLSVSTWFCGFGRLFG